MLNCIVFSDMTGGSGKSQDGTLLTSAVLQQHSAAIASQLANEFALAWDSAPVACRVGAPGGTDVGSGERLCGYWQTSDAAGAAGYHATDPQGKPYAKIFLDDASAMSSGAQAASVIASHECLEMTLDPTANLFAARTDGTLDAYEASDAVEDTTYAAVDGQTTLSNFLLPSAFDPGAVGPFDYLKVLQNQYDTTPGGYRITGTVTLNQDGSLGLKYVARGLSAEKKIQKSRSQSRVSLRGAVIE